VVARPVDISPRRVLLQLESRRRRRLAPCVCSQDSLDGVDGCNLHASRVGQDGESGGGSRNDAHKEPLGQARAKGQSGEGGEAVGMGEPALKDAPHQLNNVARVRR
jgi:hypothetical protein